MKKNLLIVFAILTARFLSAQPLPQWSSSVSSNFANYTYDNPKMKMDNAGDLIVVAGIDNGVTKRDIVLIKYSPSGNIVWQQQFNGVNNKDDEATEFDIDSLNNIFITGSSQIDSLNYDLITLKYFPNGSFDWLNSFNGTGNTFDIGYSIAVDQTGNSYVTGYTSIDSSWNHKRLIISKIDSSGNTIWTYPYGSDSLAIYEGHKIRIFNNQIAILGRYTSTISYISKYVAMRLDTSGALVFANEGVITRGVSSYHIDNIGNFYFGAFASFKITKVNANGNFAWLDSIPTNLPSNVNGDELTAITSDTLQNIYVTGRHYGDDYGGPTYSNADILVIKYAPNGNQIWNKRYEYQSNNAADIGNDIFLDNAMNVYVAGQSGRDLTDYDYVVIRYDSNGDEIGTIRYNDTLSGDDVITSILVEDSMNIYVTGVTYGSPLSSTTTQKYASVSGVGIFEINNTSLSINAFPNPFSDITTISFPNKDNENFSFQLYDYSGKIILEQKTSGNKIDISSDSLPIGLYTFKLLNDKKIYNGKIIKAK